MQNLREGQLLEELGQGMVTGLLAEPLEQVLLVVVGKHFLRVTADTNW